VPPEPSVEVGSAASAVGDAADDVAEAASEVGCGVSVEALGEVEGVAVRVRLASEDGEDVPASPVAVALRGAFVVVRGALVVRGADVVVRGADVVFGVVVAGADVAAGAGGAIRGCWPEPNRKPMTLPAGGS